MSYLRGLSSRADRSATGSLRRISLSFSLIVLGVSFLTMVLAPAVSEAQFQLWGEFPVENPFSVTTAIRGLNPPPGPGDGPPLQPMVRMEGLAGYFSLTSFNNEFDYHGSVALPADDSSGVRVVNTRSPIDFSDSGPQSAFTGFCCSNGGQGLDDNRSMYTVTDSVYSYQNKSSLARPNDRPRALAACSTSLFQSASQAKSELWAVAKQSFPPF